MLIHLPGLVLTKEISKVLQGLAQVGLTFRGLYGEGSEVVGNFFQLSNQTTLGSSEHELLDHLGKMVRQVMDYEEQARQVLLRDAPAIIEDKVWRAYGLLRYARALSFEEAMNLLSGVRLGVGVSLIPGRRDVHPQQAVGVHPAGPPGGGGGGGADRGRSADSAGTVRAQSVGIRSGASWMSRGDGFRSELRGAPR